MGYHCKLITLLSCLCFPILTLADSWSNEEFSTIKSLGPWPPEWRGDPSNRLSKKEKAIALGQQLFFDRRLSKDNLLACGDCHRPDAEFADGIALNRGFAPLERNTPSLLNVRHNRWFGWGGEHDNLWSQSIRPILEPTEMNTDVSTIRSKLQDDPMFVSSIETLTQIPLNKLSDDEFLVFIGKLLAAYQETLVTPVSRFDRFRNALVNQQPTKDLFTDEEKRGLEIFIGDGRCALCHGGANFSFGEFADIGVPFFTASGVDRGRYAGIQNVKNDPFNLLSDYNDDTEKATATRTEFVTRLHRNWGEFRVPSLRNVSNTAPYMHNGSIKTLSDVVEFYSQLNEERLHSDGERILRPLNLSESDANALEAFLKTL